MCDHSRLTGVSRRILATLLCLVISLSLCGLALAEVPYVIPEGATVGPIPNAENYGSVPIEDAAKILEVAKRAEEMGLLEPGELNFDPEAHFGYESPILYYLDETIFAVCWKEHIWGNTCSFAEIKVADASQFRRKLAGDMYQYPQQFLASELSRQVNAVIAMNADFYQFREYGVVVYDREIYRCDPSPISTHYTRSNYIDNCFVTAGGDLLFVHRGEEMTPESLRNYIDENDVLFSIAFGPILVENGEPYPCFSYPVGEVDQGYSRAGIGQLGPRHYLYMSLNHSPQKEARWDTYTFAVHFASKGVEKAYCLDGGQTGEVVFQHEPYNYMDYGVERTVSDILYFCTALPEN